MRVIVHDKSSLAPEGKPVAFCLDPETGFSWIGEYDITADELLSGAGGNTATKTEQAEKLILDLLADGKELASEDIVKAAAEAGISERTVQNAKRNMGGILGARRVGGQWYNFIKKKQPPNPQSESAKRRTLCTLHSSHFTRICVNNSKKHLTKRFMGAPPADIAPYMDKGLLAKCPSHPNRADHHIEPPRRNPKYARNKNIWSSAVPQRQDAVLRQAQPAPVPFLLCGHGPQGDHPERSGRPAGPKGYRIKSLNLINFKKSMRYNPLAYIPAARRIF